MSPVSLPFPLTFVDGVAELSGGYSVIGLVSHQGAAPPPAVVSEPSSVLSRCCTDSLSLKGMSWRTWRLRVATELKPTQLPQVTHILSPAPHLFVSGERGAPVDWGVRSLGPQGRFAQGGPAVSLLGPGYKHNQFLPLLQAPKCCDHQALEVQCREAMGPSCCKLSFSSLIKGSILGKPGRVGHRRIHRQPLPLSLVKLKSTAASAGMMQPPIPMCLAETPSLAPPGVACCDEIPGQTTAGWRGVWAPCWLGLQLAL